MDKYASQLVSRLGIGQLDLIQNKFYQVEDLNLGRKRYPMTDVLYLIEPVKESVQKVCADFVEDDKIDYDQYGAVHFAFLYPASQDILRQIGGCPKLTSRVLSILEVNLDFGIFEDNIFVIDDNSGKTKFDRKTVARQLLTLCSCLTEKTYVQIKGDS